MIRSTKNQEKKFYIVNGGDWEASILSKDAIDAAAYGLEKAFDEYGEDLLLGNCLTVTNASDIQLQEPDSIEIDIFYVPSILSDIGKNDLASQLDIILRKNKKKA